MSLPLFDTHAHYFDEKFSALEGGADVLLREKVFDAGICGVVDVATNPENSKTVIEQAAKYEKMYCAVGIHPEDAAELSGDPDEEVAKIESLLREKEKNKIVAIGEIGLDYHWEPYDKALQMTYFHDQLTLAEETGMPVIIHDREAHGDVFDAVLRHRKARGVMHSYSGSPETVRELTRRGWYISFSGTVSFKNANRVRLAAAAVPDEYLLLETDCPYLAPHPHRGELNHSGLLVHTAQALADARNTTVEKIAELTAENAKRFFGLL